MEVHKYATLTAVWRSVQPRGVSFGCSAFECRTIGTYGDVVTSGDELELEFFGTREPELGHFNFRAETELNFF